MDFLIASIFNIEVFDCLHNKPAYHAIFLFFDLACRYFACKTADIDHNVLVFIKRLEMNGSIFADKVGMVQQPVLFKGRVVLLGDAGYCPTPLSGMGASLSIYGAKALVHYIGTSPDLNQAFENYNTLMQPIIQKFQHKARKNAKTFLPMSKRSLTLNRLLIRHIPSSLITKKISSELTLTEQQINFFKK